MQEWRGINGMGGIHSETTPRLGDSIADTPGTCRNQKQLQDWMIQQQTLLELAEIMFERLHQ